MNLKIIFPENSKNDVTHLKRILEKASIDGLHQTNIERTTHNKNEMGAGAIIGSISTVIEAAQKPLTELVMCLQNYVNNYRTEITIPTKNGNIVLVQGRSMTPEQLNTLVVAILNSK